MSDSTVSAAVTRLPTAVDMAVPSGATVTVTGLVVGEATVTDKPGSRPEKVSVCELSV